MNVLMVTAEMAPLVKVGGLADVTGALPAALAARGHAVRVVLPLYGHLDRAALGLEPRPETGAIPLRVGQAVHPIRFWTWTGAPAGVQVDLVECRPLYGRHGVYADDQGVFFGDSLERASALGAAALMLPELIDWPVHVLHAHDVQAAPALIYRRRWYAGRELPGPAATLLTIHNVAHQLLADPLAVERLGLPRELAQYPGPFEFYGQSNLLKAGIVEAEHVNTVSPTYAREATTDAEAGCGLQGVLAARGDAFSGILNGADYGVWDPASDRHLPARYHREDLVGKAVCRARLLAEAGLEDSPRPLLGMVGRLVPQKGIDIVLDLCDRLVSGDFSLVILGTGDLHYHELLAEAAARHPGRIAFLNRFSERLAHRIYAGSDLFLMPSRFEPCGLSQLYSLRYGTPPVVRRTGGLADTVTDADAEPDRGTGFLFAEATADGLWGALQRARSHLGNSGRWRTLQRRGMACDFSWSAAAASYESLYARMVPAAAGVRR